MIEKRWTLIEPPLSPSCSGAIVVSGAGTASVNGTYCPDVIPLVWTKVGGTIYEDSIYVDSAYGPFWVITSGGLASDDVSNIKYMDLSGSGPQSPGNPWTGWAGSPTDITGLGDIIGGAAPAPSVMMGGAQAPDFDAPLSQWTSYRSVNPVNLVKFTEEPDLNIGLIARRRKLSSDIVFTGDDYAFFLHYQRRRSLRCEEFYIRREWKCGGVWREVWTGVFSVGSGEWDHDLCTFSVRPETYDRYTCLMRGMGEKVNLLDIGPTTVSAVIVSGGLEFGICYPDRTTKPDGCSGGDGEGGINQFDIGWGFATSFVYGGENVNLYWRERAITNCVAGSPVPPPGAGWGLRVNNCGGAYNDLLPEGTAFYTRAPIIPYTFGTPEYCPDPDAGCCSKMFPAFYFRTPFSTTSPSSNAGRMINGIPTPWRICIESGTQVEYERARPLQDCMWLLVERTGCSGIENVVSDFFEWSAPGDTPGYSAGINYVTGEANQVDHLVILQKSDAIDPTASNPATIGEITLKELLQFLVETFRVYWIIDNDGNLRLEHISAWRSQSGLDLTTYSEDSLIEPMAYAATSDEAPRVERLKWAEAQGRDFVGTDITYSGPCAASENEKSWNAAPFTSDINYISTDPDAIARDGFAILSCRLLDDLSLQAIIELGAITGNYTTNAPLSTANLQDAFWRHDRYLWGGRMNGTEQTFTNVTPNIQQKPVLLRFCCDVLDLSPEDVATTRLGQSFFAGALGAILRIEINEEDDWSTMSIRYSL